MTERWQPRTEFDIQHAIDEGLLRETHFLDMKREVEATAGGRKELARDLVSFALDGGALLIGVEEDKEARTWRLAPRPLDGLPERIELVAATLADPPLFVLVHEIPSDADPSRGYVFVEVPESSRAPHMVDNIYFGRGDRTRTRLSDHEVVRHHARREPVEAMVARLLEEERHRDPVHVEQQRSGRLYVVAQPLTARRDVAVALVRGDSGNVYSLIDGVERSIPTTVREFAPSPRYATHFATRANGVARCTSAVSGPGRTFHRESDYTTEEKLLDIELREDGGIRVLMGRMTSDWGRENTPRVITDGLAVAYVLRTVLWAVEIGQRSGYHGSWGFGLLATGLRGLASSVYQESVLLGSGPTYDTDTYQETTVATTREMAEKPRAVTERLVGRLLRGLGSQQQYGPVLEVNTDSP